MAAQGLCPRNSSVELPSPFRCFRSVVVDRQLEDQSSMFGMPNITEVDGTIPPSYPHEDFALEVSASSCNRRIQATETENSFRSRSRPARPAAA
jgi:hypothetical protein